MDKLDVPFSQVAFINSLKEKIRLSSSGYHIFDDSDIDINIDLSKTPLVNWGLSEQSGSGNVDYVVQLDVATLSKQTVYTTQIPLRLRQVKGVIPAIALTNGAYLVRPILIAPDQKAHEVSNSDNQSTAVIFFGIHRGRNYMMDTVFQPSEPLLTQTRFVGNPNQQRFPEETPLHTYARSVWDLQLYNERIYIGCGDWGYNQGPAEIWSFGAHVTFTKELMTHEHAIENLSVLSNRLVAPGIDAIDTVGFGTLYLKNGETWQEIYVPGAKHIFDATVFNDTLYLTAGTDQGATFYESQDWGETWKRYSMDETQGFRDWFYWQVVAFADDLLVTTHRGVSGAERIYRFKESVLSRHVVSLFPGMSESGYWDVPHRLTSFGDGLLYTIRQMRQQMHPKPLFYLRSLDAGAVVLEQFQDKSVQDILVRRGLCYVLTSTPSGDDYLNEIYQSSDLTTWKLLARFTTGALAYSFERMDDIFYVGLASLGEGLSVESGSIVKIFRLRSD